MKKRTKLILWILVPAVIISSITIVLVAVFGTNPVKRASKNLTAYSINANLSSDYTLSASQTIDYHNTTGKTLSSICLHLYARAFRKDATIKPYTVLTKASCFPNGESYGDIQIQRAEINGSSANFEFSGEDADILKINTTLAPKKRTTIYLEYSITLPNCTHRMGYHGDTVNLGNFYPIVCHHSGENWLTDPYYSTGDPFVSDVSNYKVTISYPIEFSCFATGDLSSCTTNTQKTNTYSALAVRDFAIVLSKDAKVSKAVAGKTNITYVGYKQDPDTDQNVKIAKLATQYFSKQFGTYPYNNLTVVKSAFFQGGMEYPNIVLVSDTITDPQELAKVIVHEIAHQWWYGLVGNNQVTEAWLDESLAEYSTCLFFEDNHVGESYADLIKDATASYLIYVDVIDSLNGKVNLAMNSRVNDYTSEYEYTYMVYVKGVIMFDSLRDVVGKSKLVSALKKYCKKFSFKVASSADFIDIINSVCHKDSGKFFNGWLNGTNVVATTFVSIV